MFVRKKAREMLHLVNVLDYADAGKIDPHSPEDGSFDNLDLDNIRRFVQMDIRLRAQGEETVDYGRTIPSIARQVLVSFWEKPRTGFHYEEIEGLEKPVDFGSKKLDVPWSEEAYLRFKKSGDVKGLLLEHVTPIKELWKYLIELEKNDELIKSDEDWEREAGTYLRNNYRIAVVTKEQATGIDKYSGRDTNPFRNHPFCRYEKARRKAVEDVLQKEDPAREAAAGLDLSRFVHPGIKK